MSNKPMSRRSDIVLQELKDELLIYDLLINKAYCLNPTSAVIWNLCDGKNSISEIALQASKRLHESLTEDLVWLALDRFKQEDLLAEVERVEIDFGAATRREMIRKAGLASLVALPMITLVIAPAAANAQSGFACSCPASIPSSCQIGGRFSIGCYPDASSCHSAGLASDRCCNGIAFVEHTIPALCCTVGCNS